jgi:hypothetical protein
MKDPRLYDPTCEPFGHSWKRWAANWCTWMLSIPKDRNPSIDSTGENCSSRQEDANVWFLTGSFGNTGPIRRSCIIPFGKSILFPVLEKEDSFAEDIDLVNEAQLIQRCVDAMDRVLSLEASIDGDKVSNLTCYRVRSDVFELTFPKDNVYGVKPGPTKSVCDGYWLFIKPLPLGVHSIQFAGECLLDDSAVKTQLMADEAYKQLWNHINSNSTFRLEISYSLTITS